MSNLSAVSQGDRRNRYRVGKCGKYQRSAESIALQKEKLAAFWADPESRYRQSDLTRARMARPGISERIAERTAAALADPETKRKQIAGLNAAWADPAKRQRQAVLTRERMAKWRAERLEAAAIVLRQLSKAERETAMADFASAAQGRSKAILRPITNTELVDASQRRDG
jgi:hypothetical protein